MLEGVLGAGRHRLRGRASRATSSPARPAPPRRPIDGGYSETQLRRLVRRLRARRRPAAAGRGRRRRARSGDYYGGTVAAPAFGEIAELRAAVPGNRPRVGPRIGRDDRLARPALKLAELIARSARPRSAATPRSRSPGSPTTAARSARARSSSASRRRTRDGHDFAPAAVEAGRRRSSSSGSSSSSVPQVLVADARAAMAPLRRVSTATRPPSCSVAGITGTNGKTTTAFLLREILEHGGVADRPARHRQADRRRRGRGGRAHHARGDRPAGRLPRRCSTPATRLRDGGLLARAGAAPRRRDPLRRRRLHEPDPGPPRLPRRHGGLLRRQAPAVRSQRSASVPGRASSTSTTTTGRGSRGRARLRSRLSAAGRRGGLPGARGRASTPPGSRFARSRPAARRRSRIPLPGHFNVENALAALAAASALGRRPRGRGAAALAGAEPVPGRFEPIDEGQAFAVLVDYAHTPDSLENVLRRRRAAHRRAG